MNSSTNQVSILRFVRMASLLLITGHSYAAAPTINEQTGTVYVPSGETDVLTVEFANNSGGTPIIHQWYEGISGDTGNPIAGATTTSYTPPGITATANYWMRITNNDGSVDSATMTVIPYASIADLPRSQQMIIKIPDSVGMDTSKVANKVMMYIPQSYDASSKRPLYIHLHGAGNRGDHVSGLFVNTPGSELQTGNAFQFIVVRPRAISGWNLTQLNKLLNHFKADYKVDDDRVYTTGYSLGAAGVWRWTLDEIDNGRSTFGAVGVIAGNTGSFGESIALAAGQAHVPFWIFHGDQDQTVNVNPAKTMSEYLTRSGSEARFTIYPGYTHATSGEPAKMGDDDFLKWMKLQRRRAPASAASNVLSVNFYQAANDWQLIDPDETFGVESFGTVVGNWNNSTGASPAGSLVFDDGTTSTVALTSTQPDGLTWFDAGPDTPMHAGISKATNTAGTVSVTLDNLNANYPAGCYAIVYLTGEKPEFTYIDPPTLDGSGKYYLHTKDTTGNTAASISDGGSTFYFQSPDLMDRADVKIIDASPTLRIFNYPLTRTTEQFAPAGTYPEATFAVFGPYAADSVTFTLEGIVGEEAAIGGVQLFEYTPAAPSPNPAGFIAGPYASSPTEAAMEADLGSAGFGPVEYYFTETSGNYGGSDSGWQTGLTYVDDGLLPETTYSYNVTLRDALGNTTTTSAPVEVTTLGYDLSAPAILIGWHSPTAKTDSTPDDVRSGISGSTSLNKAIQTDYNSTDGSYGSVAIPGSPATANGYRLQTNGSDDTLTLTMNNNTGSDVALGSLHFDYSRTGANAPQNLTVTVSGAITAANVFTFINNSGDELGKIGDYVDVDADLSGLADHTLANGQSAVFTFTVSNAGGAYTPLALDNIAITEFPEPDTDGDGIPDAVETAWGLNPTNPADALLDLDTDGQSNYAEYVGGTDGTDSNDLLRVEITASGSNTVAVALSHTTAPRLYILEHTGALPGAWKAVDAIPLNTPAPVSFGQSTAEAAGFYKVRVLQTP